MGICKSKEEREPVVVKKEKVITTRYESKQELTNALRVAGLEKTNLLVAIDMTKSNLWSGEKSYGKNLHYLPVAPARNPGDPPKYSPVVARSPEGSKISKVMMESLNPYQFVIQVAGNQLDEFDDDHYIPTCIFGHSRAVGAEYIKDISPARRQNEPRGCVGMAGVLQAYENAVRTHELSGDTQFAPIIEWAMEIVRETRDYHILLIIGDGSIVDMENTRQALADACGLPLSVIFVGVGDGSNPKSNLENGNGDVWRDMRKLDDEPLGTIDNWQSVYLSEIYPELLRSSHPDVDLATEMLSEIPEQYSEFKRRGLLI